LFKIYIENLQVEAIIGILEEERVKEQKVVINLEIEYKYSNKFLNYKEIADFVSEKIVNEKYLLLEDALIDLSDSLKEKFPPILALKVKINKPNALKNCDVGMEIQKKY